MAYVPPTQQQMYADSGRRRIELLGRNILASIAVLREADARSFGATHEIFIDRINGVNAAQMTGRTINFDGRDFDVVKVMDPHASDQQMRGRYLRMICTLKT